MQEETNQQTDGTNNYPFNFWVREVPFQSVVFVDLWSDLDPVSFFSSISLSRSPLEQLEAEKEEREVKLKKMEQEMEQVFEMKVKEKKKKLKDSEAEVSGGSWTKTWSGAARIYTFGFLVRSLKHNLLLCLNSVPFCVTVDQQLAKKNEQMWKQLDQQNKELEEKRKQFERERAQYEEDQKSNDKKGLERSDSSSKSLK